MLLAKLTLRSASSCAFLWIDAYCSLHSSSMTARSCQDFYGFILLLFLVSIRSRIGAIISTKIVDYDVDRDQPDNSYLSPDRYNLLDSAGNCQQAEHITVPYEKCGLGVWRNRMTHAQNPTISAFPNRRLEVDDAEFGPGMPLAEPLIDSVKAAAIVGIHPKTLQRYARCNVIPGIQIGGRWRFRASVIDAWISRKYSN